jgi:uncharacterized protein
MQQYPAGGSRHFKGGRRWCERAARQLRVLATKQSPAPAPPRAPATIQKTFAYLVQREDMRAQRKHRQSVSVQPHTVAIWLAVALGCLETLSIPVGWAMASHFLHPVRNELSARDDRSARLTFDGIGAALENFDVAAPDGALLRGWIVRPGGNALGARAAPENAPRAGEPQQSAPRGWVLLFHGIGDNRAGMMGHALYLLGANFAVVMMDSRAHGTSGGATATYGALECGDERAIVDALRRRYPVPHLYALGVSMGAGIALQCAAADPRIEAVVAEAPFSSLREASYDYASLHHGPWLGRTLLRPAVIAGVLAMEREGGFDADAVSPERAVAERVFPILLIADGRDHTLPPRHVEYIYRNAIGAKQMWLISSATHSAGLGAKPEEYPRRVVEFFGGVEAQGNKAEALKY